MLHHADPFSVGSAWGDLRKAHGRAEPFGVKHWCLGNEMDGPWQVGHKTADEYGRLANEVAKTLRAFDRSLELIVCGSSNADMKTYPEWERIVLEHTYDAVDHISLHMYFANRAKNTAEYLALNAKLDAYIGAIASTIEFVRAKKRSKKRVTISFDEWNVWYHSNVQDREILAGAKGWPHAQRLLEDRAAHGVVDDIGSRAAREALDRIREGLGLVVDAVIGAAALGRRQLLLARGGGDDGGAQDLAQLHGG